MAWLNAVLDLHHSLRTVVAPYFPLQDRCRKDLPMRHLWILILLASLLAIAVTLSYSSSGGGRITFSGAIQTPTCTLLVTWSPEKTVPPSKRRYHGCTISANTLQKAQYVDIHSIRLTDLESMDLLHDFSRLDRAHSYGRERPIMLVYTYQ
jgi:hypothetical protein